MRSLTGSAPFPPLKPSGRSREFVHYTDEQKSEIVYLWLFTNNSHREIDKLCLGLDSEKSLGYQSMGVLHFLGLVKIHHSIFHGHHLDKVLAYLFPMTIDNPLLMLVYCYLRDYGLAKHQVKEINVEKGYVYNTGSLQAYYWTDKVLLNQTNDNNKINKKLLLMQTNADAAKHELLLGNRTYYYSSPTLKATLKYLYDFRCTVCGSTIYHVGWNDSMTRKNQWRYLSADVHHILPLSKGGPDSYENMICLCPNCHRKFHTGEFELKETGKKLICKDQVLGNSSELHTFHSIHLL